MKLTHMFVHTQYMSCDGERVTSVMTINNEAERERERN